MRIIAAMQPGDGHDPADGQRRRGHRRWVIAAVCAIVVILLLVLWSMRPGRQGQPGEPGRPVSGGGITAPALIVEADRDAVQTAMAGKDATDLGDRLLIDNPAHRQHRAQTASFPEPAPAGRTDRDRVYPSNG